MVLHSATAADSQHLYLDLDLAENRQFLLCQEHLTMLLALPVGCVALLL